MLPRVVLGSGRSPDTRLLKCLGPREGPAMELVQIIYSHLLSWLAVDVLCSLPSIKYVHSLSNPPNKRNRRLGETGSEFTELVRHQRHGWFASELLQILFCTASARLGNRNTHLPPQPL